MTDAAQYRATRNVMSTRPLERIDEIQMRDERIRDVAFFALVVSVVDIGMYIASQRQDARPARHGSRLRTPGSTSPVRRPGRAARSAGAGVDRRDRNAAFDQCGARYRPAARRTLKQQVAFVAGDQVVGFHRVSIMRVMKARRRATHGTPGIGLRDCGPVRPECARPVLDASSGYCRAATVVPVSGGSSPIACSSAAVSVIRRLAARTASSSALR